MAGMEKGLSCLMETSVSRLAPYCDHERIGNALGLGLGLGLERGQQRSGQPARAPPIFVTPDLIRGPAFVWNADGKKEAWPRIKSGATI